jgi:hypothetical protein
VTARPSHRSTLVGVLIFVMIGAPAALTSCAKANLVIDTTIAASEADQGKSPEENMQERADLAMAALGEAYRLSLNASAVNDASLASLSDGFAGIAYDAEEANLRDALDTRNAVARDPADPDLLIDTVLEGTEICQIAKAVFDDRSLQAFPVAGEGISVIVRMTTSVDDPIWRVDVLASEGQLAGRKVACSDVSPSRTTLPPKSTTTTKP